MKIRRISAALAILLPTVVHAGVEPQAVDMGAVKFIPTLGIEGAVDDNIFRQPNNEKDSFITKVKPELQFLAQDQANVFAFTYSGDYGFYADSSTDNYTDHTLSADARMVGGDRNRLNMFASVARLHDARGEGASEGAIATARAEPDEYNANEIGGSWEFGADGAKFGTKLDVSFQDIEYQNNRLETQFRDRAQAEWSATAYWRVAPKTRAFLEFGQEEQDYDSLPLVGPSLDSEEQSTFVGVAWDLTAKTTGSFKIGRTDKDFRSSARQGDTVTAWEGLINWAPRTYSQFSLLTESSPRETNGTGAFIDSSSTSLSWTHNWSDRMSSRVRVGSGSDEYPGSTREDDRTQFSVGLEYDFQRWLNVGVGYSFEERDSNDNVFDYDRSVFSVNATMSL